jgi:HEAT repeat protein
MQAALALGEQREERAVRPLIEALKDVDPNVRFHAIEALGKIRSPAATEPLANIAEAADFFLSFPALDALKEIGDPSVAPRIISLLKVEMLSEAAAEALGALGDEKAVIPLASLLNAPNPPTLSIASALTNLYDRFEKEFGEGAYIAEIARKGIKASGAQHLLDTLGEVRASDLRPLAIVIGWLDGPAVQRALIRLLAESSVRSEVVEALVRHGKGVTELLIEQTNSDDVEIRRTSVIALGRLGHKKATPAIVRLLLEDAELRIEAALSLAKLGDETALEGLIEMMGDPDAAVRQAVVGALNSIGSAQMSSRVQLLLTDPNPLVRESAAKIAGYFGYPDSADLLLKSCNDPDERVRQAAVEHLPFLEDVRVSEVLTNAVRNDTPRVRAAAARALAQQPDEESLDALLGALKDKDLWVRYFAARSLGNFDRPEVAKELSEIADKETHNNVRIAALESLGNVGGRIATTTIESYVDASDQDVARAAIRALQKARDKEQNEGKKDRDH